MSQFWETFKEILIKLVEQFSLEEIKEAIWLCRIDKSPYPNDFNIFFFKCQEVLRKDILDFVNKFYKNAKLPKAITESFPL